MNILTDVLPSTVAIDGRQIEVNSDFRACLRTIMAFEDNALTPQEKTFVLMANLYPIPPEDSEGALREAIWFLNGGKETEEDSDSMRLYSFSKDANFIFAAFRQTHGIDLQKDNLHWWTFLALFLDLGSETTFCNLVSLRKRIKTNKATKEERAAAREMGDLIDVPDVDDRTLEQKEQERKFLEAVNRAKQAKET